MDCPENFIGIDFSGNAARWGQNVGPRQWAVWIASLKRGRPPVVQSLLPVQSLSGQGLPFLRLAQFLRQGDFAGAGIDAPFSVPNEVMPNGVWTNLIDAVDRLPLNGRPFPRADTFLRMLGVQAPRQTLRYTEQYWRNRGLNGRSSLWWTPRGGAPFAAACMKLIATAGKSRCWPWARPPQRGFLVEAFPAAQLKQWNLEYQRYNRPEGEAVRREIVGILENKVDFHNFEGLASASADALDAVLAAFAAMAVASATSVMPEGLSEAAPEISQEGWIAVSS